MKLLIALFALLAVVVTFPQGRTVIEKTIITQGRPGFGGGFNNGPGRGGPGGFGGNNYGPGFNRGPSYGGGNGFNSGPGFGGRGGNTIIKETIIHRG